MAYWKTSVSLSGCIHPATSSLLVEARSAIKQTFFPCLFWFSWGIIWMIPGRELWCTLALRRTVTAGWKQGDTDICISLVTQNIQPRRPWSVMDLKETEFYNWFFKIWWWLLFFYSYSLLSPPKDRYLLNGIWMIGTLTFLCFTMWPLQVHIDLTVTGSTSSFLDV